MTENKDRERICWIYLLVSNAITSAFAITEPPHVWWRFLLNLVLPLAFVAISAWQLLNPWRRGAAGS